MYDSGNADWMRLIQAKLNGSDNHELNVLHTVRNVNILLIDRKIVTLRNASLLENKACFSDLRQEKIRYF